MAGTRQPEITPLFVRIHGIIIKRMVLRECWVVLSNLGLVLVWFAVVYLLSVAAWILVWVWRGGTSIAVPWGPPDVPGFSPFSHRRRTRDRSLLQVRNPDACAIIFWRTVRRPGTAMWIADAITGFSGVCGAGLEIAHGIKGETWITACADIRISGERIDGPHYAPLRATPHSAMARIDISAYIDARRLRADVQATIENPAVRHKGASGIAAYLFGRTRPDRVVCSSLLGNAILRQPETALGSALRQALRERLSLGEITPSDLARAAAILRLRPDGAAEPIRTVPILARCRPPHWCGVHL